MMKELLLKNLRDKNGDGLLPEKKHSLNGDGVVFHDALDKAIDELGEIDVAPYLQDEGYVKAKDYHSLGKEIAELLKDPEAMKGLSLERQFRKLGYVKLEDVRGIIGEEKEKWKDNTDMFGIGVRAGIEAVDFRLNQRRKVR